MEVQILYFVFAQWSVLCEVVEFWPGLVCSVQWTILRMQYAVLCAVFSGPYSVCSGPYAVKPMQYAVDCMQYVAARMQYAVARMQWIVYCIQWTVCSVWVRWPDWSCHRFPPPSTREGRGAIGSHYSLTQVTCHISCLLNGNLSCLLNCYIICLVKCKNSCYREEGIRDPTYVSLTCYPAVSSIVTLSVSSSETSAVRGRREPRSLHFIEMQEIWNGPLKEKYSEQGVGQQDLSSVSSTVTSAVSSNITSPQLSIHLSPKLALALSYQL